MELIRWWKNKHALIIALTLIIIVVECAICGLVIPFPYNLIVIFILCIIYGIAIRKLKAK
jgi:hypothetical protein